MRFAWIFGCFTVVALSASMLAGEPVAKQAVPGVNTLALTPLGQWKIREGVGSILFSPNGQAIYAVSGRSGALRESGELGILDVRTREAHQLPLGISCVTAAASRDGSRLAAAGEGGLVIVDLSERKVIKRFPPLDGDRIGPRVIGFVDKDRAMVVVSRKALELWTAEEGPTARPLKGDADPAIWTAALSVDKTWLVTVSPDGVIQVWDVQSWESVMAYAQNVPGHDVQINRNGSVVYSHGVEEFGRLLDVKKGTVQARIEVKGANVAAFSPDGSVLALGLLDGRLQICDGATGKPLTRIDAFSGEPQNRVRSVAFAPDGSRVAASTFDGRVRVWEMKLGRDGEQ